MDRTEQRKGCACTSCQVTNEYADRGFAEWPKGNPAGKKALADYAAHRAFCLKWGPGREPEIPAGIWQRDPFPCKGTPRVDPHAAYKFPGKWCAVKREHIPMPESVNEYVRAFEKLNGLKHP